MKKVLVTLSLVLTLGLGAMAQNDAFFSYNDVDNQQRGSSLTINPPALPDQGDYGDQEATPLGSGLLLLAGMGAAYALRRKNK